MPPEDTASRTASFAVTRSAWMKSSQDSHCVTLTPRIFGVAVGQFNKPWEAKGPG